MLLPLLAAVSLASASAVDDPPELLPPDLKITDIPDELDAFDSTFSKYIGVFGVHVFGTARTPDAKLRHIACVLAEYLDNDEDGLPDNPRVVEAMASRDMAMVIAASERELDESNAERLHGEGFHHTQFQHAGETKPGRGRFDATLEEVLHLVTMGYAEAYPRVFGPRSGTALGECLDRARGGHFTRVPRKYPEKAWFHYDDRSCEYSCMAVEYLYWALTSLLGAQSDSDRQRDIANEWRLATPEKIREGDPWIVALLTDPVYRWATRIPDGRYRPGRDSDSR